MEIAVLLLTILAKYGPEAYAFAVEVMHTEKPTKEQYLKLLDLVNKDLHDE